MVDSSFSLPIDTDRTRVAANAGASELGGHRIVDDHPKDDSTMASIMHCHNKQPQETKHGIVE
ncbi:hypothetical protein [Novipirellula galeiformis]|uniref:hypothetical protein n=1 Tax=Novipirellula galeiformis TaxID=2528004 RepID=UPI0011B6E910|nr:hypothetical protein [Novipirellula galeiformis]